MTYQTLYRKYRPKSFELVFGQDVIVKTLKNIIKNNKLSHAYLFTGPRGTGKTSCAKLFAKAINCMNNTNGDACNNCEQCYSFNNNSNPDIIEIDAASNNGVDEIREIKSKITLVPSLSKYKVYIIDEVHMLSIGAFNALLKTLEEPPEYVIFILATTEPQKLPNTVISRCQRFDFKKISDIQMKKCLLNIIKNEKIFIEEDAIDEIIYNSDGGLRDAIGMLDQASAFSNNKISVDDINLLSGNIGKKELFDLFEDILNSRYKNIIQKSESFSESGKDFYLITKKIINLTRKGLIYEKTNDKRILLVEEQKLLQKYDYKKFYMVIKSLSTLLIELSNSYNTKITFETNLLQLSDEISNISNENIVSSNYATRNNDASRETLSKTEEKTFNVSRETSLEKEEEIRLINLKQKLKEIRINNVLKESTKKELMIILEKWFQIKKYLVDSEYKICAGILIDSKPVAASEKGIVISLPLESSTNRIEKMYEKSKKMLEKILDKEYKIIYISNDTWKKIRPEFVEKAKKNKLETIDEKQYLDEIKKLENKVESFIDFNELIEMEEK